MGSPRRRVAFSVAFVLATVGVHVALTRRYGELAVAYVTEGTAFLLTAVAIAILTWIAVSFVRVEARLFVPVALVCPFVGLVVVSVALGGGGALHPAFVALGFVYVAGFLGGLGVRALVSRRGDRADALVEPIARRRRAIVTAGGLLLAVAALSSAARVPAAAVVDRRQTNEYGSVYLTVAVASDPRHLRLVLETPTDAFDAWIPRAAFDEGVATGDVRLARPSAAPPTGRYDLRIETVWGRTAAAQSFTFDDGPHLEVTAVSVGREAVETIEGEDLEEATTVAFDVANGGDASAPVWDHALEIDGREHRIRHDAGVIHPSETRTVGGPIGTHPPAGGAWEPVRLEPGTYEAVFRLESVDRTLLVYETTLEVGSA